MTMPLLYLLILFQAWQKHKQFPHYKQALHILLKAKPFIKWREDNLILVLLVNMEISLEMLVFYFVVFFSIIDVMCPSFYPEPFCFGGLQVWCGFPEVAGALEGLGREQSQAINIYLCWWQQCQAQADMVSPRSQETWVFILALLFPQWWIIHGLGYWSGSLCLSFLIFSAKGPTPLCARSTVIPEKRGHLTPLSSGLVPILAVEEGRWNADVTICPHPGVC